MINTGTLTEAIVAKLRDMPDMVAAHGGDATKIRAYHGRYPDETNIREAVYALSAPGTLVAFAGLRVVGFPGINGARDTNRYDFELYIRSREVLPTDLATAGFHEIIEALGHGVVTGSGFRLMYDTIDSRCLPFGKFSEVAPIVDEENCDLVKVVLSLHEIGDN